MKLKHLDLTHFRNYDKVSLDFHDEVNVLIGSNAQGKTNLLEAIYCLALAKSHRATQDKELIQWQADFALIEGELEYRYGTMPLSLQISAKGKKAKANHLEQSKLTQYVGHMNVVLFAPEDLSLVKGSPQVRRRFIDIEIGQISAVYLNDLSNYQRILKQKNHYLKQLKSAGGDRTMLEVLNQQFAEYAAKLTLRRQQFIAQLEEKANEIHRGITKDKENLKIHYDASLKITEDMVEETYNQLSAVMDREIDRMTSLYGPHRDDLSFTINDIDVQTYGSQGQQRTTALSMKLAEIELINEEVGEYPILLLDDVLSELDDSRQTHLLSTIQHKVQTFVTTTSVDGIEHETIQEAKLFFVDQGSITNKE
ncbi:DNA replication/repair protein RecF [Macrococcus brunensis]|uniref:DNA replication and repair protein RecF n=1 Tax=Macrococcus brunensis TaxID=198483 RepID=A0A4R6BBI6_9STAP|nr:DNA replication/repair protein RecF [Macrococcus brunensis]TDL94349.1 DNA replication/repair protein RecF [Macrococcus brunensis]ULG71953.1 DNA replication/repair protein RecF [Macrococcus brunensis]ULG74200.1 DNA replication/repair protein RecF [Macrococcus brunensis]